MSTFTCRDARRLLAGAATLTTLAAGCLLPGVASAASSPVAGLPPGAAAAALEPEPPLAAPSTSEWPFPSDFSRTAGTGRLIDGTFEWTDSVYDANGAATVEELPPLSAFSLSFSPAAGDYIYPNSDAGNDGADIFTASVGLTRSDTYWRVDWNTLINPSVPIAEWTFDTDNNPRTGISEWPADANVSSPGIDKALVVSAAGAELIDAVTGKTIAHFPTMVDVTSKSFIVKIPRSVLPVSGAWRVRLAAGLANSAGTAFAEPTRAGGLPAGSSAARVYNVTFRTVAQEPPEFTDGQTDALIAAVRQLLKSTPVLGPWGVYGVTSLITGNFWNDDDQADALAQKNVSKFSVLIHWSQLARKKTTQPPLVRGYSTRWYQTDIPTGQGISGEPEANPTLLGNIQPYSVYVPTDYTGRKALPLTIMLHAAGENYNMYGANDPRLVQEACQDRDSICVEPEGFGPLSAWKTDGEHDVWQVWRQMALNYKIDPNRTLLTGYSMGAIGTYTIGMTYPQAFGEAMVLDGLPDDADGYDDGCTTQNRVDNVHWVPYVISNAVTDEAAIYPLALDVVSQFQADDNQYSFFSTTFPTHEGTWMTDGFSSQVAALDGAPAAVADPGTVNYTWCSGVVDQSLGLGPTSVYWLSGLTARTASSNSQIVADDGAIPEPAITEKNSTALLTPSDAPPKLRINGTWQLGATPAANSTLTLTLTNVGAVTVDTQTARLPHGQALITSDGSSQVVLANLAPGTAVHTGATTQTVGATGTAVVNVGDGTTVATWSPAGQSASPK